MNHNTRRRWDVPGALILGAGMIAGVSWARAEGPPALEGPAAGGEILADAPVTSGPSTAVDGPLHEAFLPPGSDGERDRERARAAKSPPPPIVERPTADRPGPDAQWVAGYWTWDPARNDFSWVPGAWRVAPRDRIWVNGRWQRDVQGWSRVPGFWSARQRAAATFAAPVRAADAAPDWKLSGPPADHPADDPGPPPEADAFYVPGRYVPEGDRLAWKPGFWSPVKAGWDWVPARWVRRPGGWDYRDGYWVRDPAAAVSAADPTRRHTVARPSADDGGLPPAIVESEPVRPDGLEPRASRRDPISEAEAGGLTMPTPRGPTVVIVPGGPVMVRRPFGYYGPRPPRVYDPYGVIPPFARRILDRVLP